MTTMLHVPAPYPLAWPDTKPRTPLQRREAERYAVRSFADAIAGIEAEVRRWAKGSARIINWELTSNISGRARQDPDDPGAAFWFELAAGDATIGADLCVLACDRFQRVAQNIRAISLTLERLRLVDELGSYSLVAAVSGAKALPPPASAARERAWYLVLAVAPAAPLAVAEASYRALAKAAGEGSPRLVELNRAIAEARKELK
jgi:hypothetical protein